MTLVSETNNTHVILLSQYDSTCVPSVPMTWKTMATTTFHPPVCPSVNPSAHPFITLDQKSITLYSVRVVIRLFSDHILLASVQNG